MSREYTEYVKNHKANVVAGFEWLQSFLPDLVKDIDPNFIWTHDQSKYDKEEYDAYDAYFYGNNRSYAVVEDFNRAWLRHIHHNPHHWQYWCLIEDEPNKAYGKTVLNPIEMPYWYIIEMICDWWSFSRKSGNLYAIFDWYEKHKQVIILHYETRKTVERILAEIKNKLDELGYKEEA